MPPFPGPPIPQANASGAIPTIQVGVPGGTGGTPNGFQAIADLSAAVALTIPANTTYCLVTPTAQAVRWRDDGAVPTAAVGMPIAVNAAPVQFSGASMAAVKFIQQAASAALCISYYR